MGSWPWCLVACPSFLASLPFSLPPGSFLRPSLGRMGAILWAGGACGAALKCVSWRKQSQALSGATSSWGRSGERGTGRRSPQTTAGLISSPRGEVSLELIYSRCKRCKLLCFLPVVTTLIQKIVPLILRKHLGEK